MKKDDPKTPAKPSERRTGSKVNPEGSASSSNNKIKLSASINTALSRMVREHNKENKAKNRKVTIGMLRAVFRRGAGAFSVSHRPSVTSRNQWAFARVKAFLRLVATGRRKPTYTTDLDLLPAGHPQKKVSKSQKSSDKSFTVPLEVRRQAARGLELRRKHGRGGLDTRQAAEAGVGSGVQRASDLISGSVSYETVKRMLSFFRRHETYKKRGYHKDKTSAAYISWLLWGGDAGYAWAKRTVQKEENVQRGSLYGIYLFGSDFPLD